MLGLLLLGVVNASETYDAEGNIIAASAVKSPSAATPAKKIMGHGSTSPSTSAVSLPASVSGKTLDEHLRGISSAELQAALQKAGEHGKAGKAYALTHAAAVAEIGAQAENDAEASFRPKIDALVALAKETDDALKALYRNLSAAGVSHGDLQREFGKGNVVLKKIAESLKPAVSLSTVKQDEFRDFDTTHAARLDNWKLLAPAVQQKMEELESAGTGEALWFASKGAGKDLLAAGNADGSAVTAVDAIAAYKAKAKFEEDKEIARLAAEQEAGITSAPPVAYPSGGVAADLVE